MPPCPVPPGACHPTGDHRRERLIECFALTDRGRRRPTNQDAAFASCRQQHVLLAVADGMGGAPAGAQASALAIAAFEQSPTPGEEPAAFLRDHLAQADAAIAEAQRRDVALAGMGSTLVAAFAAGGQCWLTHVGDSRAYLWDGAALTALTADHSVAAEAARAGTISPAEARTDNRRHLLTRAVNGRGPEGEEAGPVPYDADCALLLVSDGVTDTVPDEQLTTILHTAHGAAAARAIATAALEAGGPDNIAVAIADWRC